MVMGTTLATHDAGTGAWYNPAALGGLPRSSVQVSTSIYTLAVRNIDGIVETRLPWETRRDGLSATDFTTIPSGISFVFRLSPRFGLSLGLFSPIREYASFDSQVSSAPADGSAIFGQTLAISQRVDSTQVGIGFGWAPIDAFRIGATVLGTQDTTEIVTDYSFSGTATASKAMLFAGSIQRQLASQFGFRGVLGAQWDAAKFLSFALAVRSPIAGIAANGHETTTVYGGLGPAGVPGAVGGYQQQVIDAKPSAMASPARLYWAAQATAGRVRFALEGDIRHPIDDSSCGEMKERRCTAAADKWVANARLGAMVQASDNIWVGMGGFTDMDGRSVERSGYSVDFFGGTAGVQFRSPNVVRLRANGDPWDLRTSISLRYGVGVGHFASSILDLTQLQITANPTPASATFHEISLNIGTSLEF
jgi:hypothetical protein